MIGGATDWIVGLHGWAALAVVFLLPALESSAFVGLVVPGEVGVLLGGVLASRGNLALGAVLAAAVAGAVVGDTVGYEVGKRWGRRMLQGAASRLVFSREMLRFLKSGGMLGVLIDQDTNVGGHFVPFFGRPAFTPRAAGDLAARLNAPMVFGCAHRLAGNMHSIVLRRVDVARTGDRETDSLALTAAATKMIEDEIRANPSEWVWMHPRWRTPPAM